MGWYFFACWPQYQSGMYQLTWKNFHVMLLKHFLLKACSHSATRTEIDASNLSWSVHTGRGQQWLYLRMRSIEIDKSAHMKNSFGTVAVELCELAFFFISMRFLAKIMPNNRLAPSGVGAPSPGNPGSATIDVNKYLTFLPTRKSNLLVAMVTRNPAPMNVSGVIAMYICKQIKQ